MNQTQHLKHSKRYCPNEENILPRSLSGRKRGAPRSPFGDGNSSDTKWHSACVQQPRPLRSDAGQPGERESEARSLQALTVRPAWGPTCLGNSSQHACEWSPIAEQVLHETQHTNQCLEEKMFLLNYAKLFLKKNTIWKNSYTKKFMKSSWLFLCLELKKITTVITGFPFSCGLRVKWKDRHHSSKTGNILRGWHVPGVLLSSLQNYLV